METTGGIFPLPMSDFDTAWCLATILAQPTRSSPQRFPSGWLGSGIYSSYGLVPRRIADDASPAFLRRHFLQIDVQANLLIHLQDSPQLGTGRGGGQLPAFLFKFLSGLLILLALSEVLFIPAGQPWLKADREITPAEHRVEMVRLAIAGNPHFKLSTMEIERPGPSYTTETLTELRGQLGSEDELYFIIGMDDLVQLPRWKDPEKLVKLCFVVVAPRPGYEPFALESLEKDIPGLSQRVIFINSPQLDVSASEIRGRVAKGLSINHLVPESVNRYIKQQGLYRSE
ncbi:nicotinate-nucleotide adenylyltransferase [Chloroflexota bacterium]